MTTIFIRTIIIYVVLLTSMRLMGKRQIGELEISDLITTLLVSEIASLPITDTNIPISHAIIPIIILLTFEVASSWLLVKFPFIKKYISTHATTLIENGKLRPAQMQKVRLTATELISELRQNGISDISEVQYAILEQNGKISVIQKPEYRQPTARDMNIKLSDSGFYNIIIENGMINSHGMSAVGMSKSRLHDILNKRKLKPKQIYLMLVSTNGEIEIIKKEKK